MEGEVDAAAAFERLKSIFAEWDEQRGTGDNHGFYLSIPPKAFELACRQVSGHGLAQGSH